MDISGITRTQGTQAAGKAAGTRRTTGGKDFRSLLDIDEAEEAGAAAATGGIRAVGALLFAQETGDALEGRQKNKNRASHLLDKLDDLKMDILTGAVSVHKLQSLSHMAAQERSPMDDPELSGILDEIELRAAIELAKLGA